MAAQEPEVASDLASQATAPSHALDSESQLSQPSVIVEAEPEAEPGRASDVWRRRAQRHALRSTFLPGEPRTHQRRGQEEGGRVITRSEEGEEGSHPFEVWLREQEERRRKKKAKFVAMMGGTISASVV